MWLLLLLPLLRLCPQALTLFQPLYLLLAQGQQLVDLQKRLLKRGSPTLAPAGPLAKLPNEHANLILQLLHLSPNHRILLLQASHPVPQPHRLRLAGRQFSQHDLQFVARRGRGRWVFLAEAAEMLVAGLGEVLEGEELIGLVGGCPAVREDLL
jgi:hypothetical protein